MLARWHQLSKKAQWVIAAAVVLGVLGIVGSLAGTSDEPTTAAPTTETTETVTETITTETPEAPAPEPEPAQSFGTAGQENALESAESYLNTSAFSRKGLIEQLEYEGYSRADATWAVDNVAVNWNEQAALSAQAYLRTSSFSRSGLVDQLIYEGFSRAQAEHGVRVAY
jgi:hypothetical protein